MNNQREVEQFWSGFLKHVLELQNEFDHLSDESKTQVAEQSNAFSRGYGYAVVAEDVLRKCIR